MKRSLAVTILLVFPAIAGCNHSRYGIAHDRWLPEIKKVAIFPAGINVSSRHAGGILEPRPDLIPGVQSRAVATLRQEVSSRGRDHGFLANEWEEKDRDAIASRLELLSAIAESIHTHHYEHGNETFFEYTCGDTISAVFGDIESDALLLVYINAVVPTAGRKVLAGTAVVVGILTGIHVAVSTDEAVITLMLVHKDSGEVLWYNVVRNTADVESERQLRKLVEKASQYLLEPFEE